MKPVCYYFMTVFPVPEHCCGNSVVDGSAFLGRIFFFFCLFNICLVLIFFLLNVSFILAFYLFILKRCFWLKNKFLLDICVYICYIYIYIQICIYTCIQICKYTYMCLYIHVHACICVYIYIYIFTYTYIKYTYSTVISKQTVFPLVR